MIDLNRSSPPPASLAARVTKASDSIDPSTWLPPQWAQISRICIGKRWINVLRILPIAFVVLVLVLGVAVCQGLYDRTAFQQYAAQYPGIAKSALAVHTGYPLWLRVGYFLNLFFMFFIIRSGLQILADHPRLYWNRDCTPDTDWFRRTWCGPPKATRSRFRSGWASPEFAIRSGPHAAGISPSICCGC